MLHMTYPGTCLLLCGQSLRTRFVCARFLCAAEVRCNDGAPRVVCAAWLLRAAVEARRVVQTVQCHSEFRAHLVIDELSMLGSVFIGKIFYRASMLFLHLTFYAHDRNLRRCCQFVGILWCKYYTRESVLLMLFSAFCIVCDVAGSRRMDGASCLRFRAGF